MFQRGHGRSCLAPDARLPAPATAPAEVERRSRKLDRQATSRARRPDLRRTRKMQGTHARSRRRADRAEAELLAWRRRRSARFIWLREVDAATYRSLISRLSLVRAAAARSFTTSTAAEVSAAEPDLAATRWRPTDRQAPRACRHRQRGKAGSHGRSPVARSTPRRRHRPSELSASDFAGEGQRAEFSPRPAEISPSAETASAGQRYRRSIFTGTPPAPRSRSTSTSTPRTSSAAAPRHAGGARRGGAGAAGLVAHDSTPTLEPPRTRAHFAPHFHSRADAQSAARLPPLGSVTTELPRGLPDVGVLAPGLWP